MVKHLHKSHPDVDRRLGRIAGHVEGIRRMLAEEKTCCEILQQVKAVMAALEAARRIILLDHVRHCLGEAKNLTFAVFRRRSPRAVLRRGVYCNGQRLLSREKPSGSVCGTALEPAPNAGSCSLVSNVLVIITTPGRLIGRCFPQVYWRIVMIFNYRPSPEFADQELISGVWVFITAKVGSYSNWVVGNPD